MSRRLLPKSERFTPAAVIEALEERRLLYDYVFNGTDNGESLVAQIQGGNLVVGIIGQPGITIPNPAGKTVLLSALGGNDTIFLNTNGGAIITVDAGAGDDTIQLGGGSSQNLGNLPGNSILMGGSGFDTVLAQDGNNPSATTYAITDARFDRPGWGGFYYQADIETLTLYSTQFNDTVNVRSTWPNQPVRVANRGGNDNVFVGNPTQGVQGIRANVYTEGVGTNTLWISDVGNRSNLSPNFDWDGSAAWGALNGFAPARIIWQAANTQQVNVTAGGGVNSFVVYGNNAYLVIDKGDSNIVGADTVQIGSPLVGGLVSILAPVQVQNTLQLSNLVITNEGNSTNRTWTIDSANGYGSLVGMAPAAIYWRNLDISTISLKCGNGSDDGTIKRLSKTLNINNSSGAQNYDQIQIGDQSVGGAQQITGGGITIDNDPWYTDVVVDNNGDLVSRTGTLDFVNGYNVLTGVAPATIRYDDNDTRHATIHTGSGLNTFNLLRTTTSGGETGVYFGHSHSSIHVGNSTNGLQSIQSTLVIGTALNVTLDNQADTVARNVTQSIPTTGIVFSRISGLAPAPIYYQCGTAYGDGSVASIRLLGGSGGNTYTISGTSDSGAFRKNFRLDTGPGDVVTVAASSVAWGESRVELIDPLASLASLTIQDGGSVVLTGPTNQILVTGSLNISGTAVLDVRDKGVIVNYSGASPIESIRAGISSGFNAGAWNGAGINSLIARSTPGTAVGFAEATDLFSTFPSTFAGQSIDNTSVLLRYTLNGDADLDRITNLVDFNRLASNFGQSQRRWSTGDFNFDTSANLTDFNALAGQFGNAMGPDGGISALPGFSETLVRPTTRLAATLAELA